MIKGMWKFSEEEVDYLLKPYNGFDPYTIYVETDKENKNKIVTIYFPLGHLIAFGLKDVHGKFVQFDIGTEQTFLADENWLKKLLKEGRLLKFPHYSGGADDTAAIQRFEKNNLQTFINLFKACIDTLKEKQSGKKFRRIE